MKETKNIEFKEEVSNTFLKTVSAYANYGTGIICFGIADDGTIRGIKDPVTACLNIENKINDSINPVPDYTLQTNETTGVITLTVQEGLHKPYLYRSKAYKRNDTATIEADRLELTRLILAGQNTSFEELPAKSQQLTFSVLEGKLKECLDLDEVTKDHLKTLELYDDKKGFNNAAELLADQNSFPGIDAVRFGDSISILLDRETYTGESILKQYDHALALYRKYYQYEIIRGSTRENVERIPEKAYREAIANALIHRTWDVPSCINVAMFEDRIEITSPGGLPQGVSEESFLRGGISQLRNRIIGTVFFRLHLIEHFGTGIRRINESYAASARKPVYKVLSDSIHIILPVIESVTNLPEDEMKVLACIRGKRVSSSEIAEAVGFGKSKVVSILKKLVASGHIRQIGSGRGTQYTAERS